MSSQTIHLRRRMSEVRITTDIGEWWANTGSEFVGRIRKQGAGECVDSGGSEYMTDFDDIYKCRLVKGAVNSL